MQQKIRFGPAGFGGVKDAISNLQEYAKHGLAACEVPFTYQIWLKKEQAQEIARAIKEKKINIFLSIHAPYWSNLNSAEKKKVRETQERILKCCEIANYLGAKRVVFHSGYYGKTSKEETYENIKKAILEMQELAKKNKWDIELCPEIMGKKNVFGSIEEISKLAEECRCGFCIDFAHILARYKDYNFKLVAEKFPQKKWHCHFSGIEYGEKGEKRHRETSEKEAQELVKNLKKFRDKEIVIINEAPNPVKDSIMTLKFL